MSQDSSIGQVWAANYGTSGKPDGVGEVWIANASAITGGGGGDIPAEVSGNWESTYDTVCAYSGAWGQGGVTLPLTSDGSTKMLQASATDQYLGGENSFNAALSGINFEHHDNEGEPQDDVTNISVGNISVSNSAGADASYTASMQADRIVVSQDEYGDTKETTVLAGSITLNDGTNFEEISPTAINNWNSAASAISSKKNFEVQEPLFIAEETVSSVVLGCSAGVGSALDVEEISAKKIVGIGGVTYNEVTVMGEPSGYMNYSNDMKWDQGNIFTGTMPEDWDGYYSMVFPLVSSYTGGIDEIYGDLDIPDNTIMNIEVVDNSNGTTANVTGEVGMLPYGTIDGSQVNNKTVQILSADYQFTTGNNYTITIDTSSYGTINQAWDVKPLTATQTTSYEPVYNPSAEAFLIASGVASGADVVANGVHLSACAPVTFSDESQEDGNIHTINGSAVYASISYRAQCDEDFNSITDTYLKKYQLTANPNYTIKDYVVYNSNSALTYVTETVDNANIYVEKVWDRFQVAFFNDVKSGYSDLYFTIDTTATPTGLSAYFGNWPDEFIGACTQVSTDGTSSTWSMYNIPNVSSYTGNADKELCIYFPAEYQSSEDWYTNGEWSGKYYEPSAVMKEMAWKDDVQPIQIVSNASQATGSNILYVVTGSV